MGEGRRKITARVLILLPYFLILYILQAMIMPRLPIFGAKPLILPLAVAAFALLEGPVAGGVVGLFAGILTDLSFNEPTVIFTLSLTLLGLAAGYFSSGFLVKNLGAYLLSCVFILLICAGVQTVQLLISSNTPLAPLAETALFQTLSSLIFAVPTYYITRFIAGIL